MYRIFADDVLFYNDSTPDLTSTKLISPSLSLKDNAAGSFTATIPIGNVCYDTIVPFDTTIDIYRKNQNGTETWLWRGRVLSVAKDFWNQKKIVCEGALAFLNDTVVPLAKLERYDIVRYIHYLLDTHNSKVSANRQIHYGAISTVSSSNAAIGFYDYITDGDNVLSYISTVVEDWNLHIRIRKDNDELLLDLLTDSQLNMSSQSINFGRNLLDYTDNFDWSDIVTAILPLGHKLETYDVTGDEDLPDRLTIEGKTARSSNLSVQGMYLVNTAAMAEHGRIEQTVEWSDVEEANELLELAELYLNDYQYNTMTLNVKVFDLHYLIGSNVEAFDFLSQINCYSKPHGLNSTFIVSEMTIPFDNPENTSFTMTKQFMGLYRSDRKVESISGKISSTTTHIPATETILKAARENAKDIVNAYTNGYVSLVPNETGDRVYALTITNGIEESVSTQMWKWTLGGLMYQSRRSVDQDWDLPAVAMTMDGAIVATRITTGIFAVDDGNGDYLILADMDTGTLQLGSFDVTATSIYNNKPEVNADETDGIYIGYDGIAVGHVDTGLFKVDAANDVAYIAGFNFGSWSIWSYDRDQLEGYKSGVYIGIDGVSTCSDGFFTALENGWLTGGVNQISGYLAFNTYINENPNDPGLRVCGKAGVVIMTNGLFGIGDYVEPDEDGEFLAGISETMEVIEGGEFSYNYETYELDVNWVDVEIVVPTNLQMDNGQLTYQNRTHTFRFPQDITLTPTEQTGSIEHTSLTYEFTKGLLTSDGEGNTYPGSFEPGAVGKTEGGSWTWNDSETVRPDPPNPTPENPDNPDNPPTPSGSQAVYYGKMLDLNTNPITSNVVVYYAGPSIDPDPNYNYYYAGNSFIAVFDNITLPQYNLGNDNRFYNMYPYWCITKNNNPNGDINIWLCSVQLDIEFVDGRMMNFVNNTNQQVAINNLLYSGATVNSSGTWTCPGADANKFDHGIRPNGGKYSMTNVAYLGP